MAIRVVATGGTIASLRDPASGAVRPAVGAEELLHGVPGLEEFGPVTVDEIDKVNGWNVTPQTMLRVAAAASRALADHSVDGVVVTHGTDTLEETAFLCDVLVDSDKPVVFAAAMRSGNEIAADGPRNLLNAARLASDPDARLLGTLVTLNDEFHAARWVRKLDSFRVSAFASPDHGPIGFVDPETVRLLLASELVRVSLPAPESFAHEVPVVQTFTGMPESLIETILDATNAGGLVVEGTGLGNVPGSAMPGIARAIERGLPVIASTRTPGGGTRPVYGGPGGGVTLHEMGVLGGGKLSAAKVRLLLMTLLSGDSDSLRDSISSAIDALR